MKIHLKDNKIALYDIESDYRQYLFQYDFRVNLKLGRRFVGIIVGIEDYTYFIPLNSKPLRKNGKRRNPRTTVEIYNESHEIIAALLINNMIPEIHRRYYIVKSGRWRKRLYLMWYFACRKFKLFRIRVAVLY